MVTHKITKEQRVIGFAGSAGAGKDTAATTLIASHPYRFRRAAFADKLKEATATLFGIDRRSLESADVKAGYIDRSLFGELTYRSFLQLFGTDGVRNHIDKDFWVKLLFHNIEKKGDNKCYLITDVRFPNEYEAIVSRGGTVYRVIRPALEEDAQVAAHSSERSLSGYELPILLNEGTKDDFCSNVHMLLEK